jgi:hypothetical protein
MLRLSCRAGNMVPLVAPAVPSVSRYASRADEPRVKDNGFNCAQSSSKPYVRGAQRFPDVRLKKL